MLPIVPKKQKDKWITYLKLLKIKNKTYKNKNLAKKTWMNRSYKNGIAICGRGVGWVYEEIKERVETTIPYQKWRWFKTPSHNMATFYVTKEEGSINMCTHTFSTSFCCVLIFKSSILNFTSYVIFLLKLFMYRYLKN